MNTVETVAAPATVIGKSAPTATGAIREGGAGANKPESQETCRRRIFHLNGRGVSFGAPSSARLPTPRACEVKRVPENPGHHRHRLPRRRQDHVDPQSLANAGRRRIALVINEFGDVGVDGEILKSCGVESCREEDIVELANGCLCCTVADDFLPAIEALLKRAPELDHIIIETSGLALPKPLFKAFDWPQVRSRLTVDGVIAVVDAAAVADGRFVDDAEELAAERAADPSVAHDNPLEEVYEDQLLCADLVILNKTDLLAADEIARVAGIIEAHATPA